MNGRVLATFLILWVLIMSPTFCLAGVLEHACTDDCVEEEVCGHEEDCQDDPCLEVIARTSSPGTGLLGSLSVGALFPVAEVLDVRQAAEAPFGPPLISLPNVPRPSSDLPLLI